MSRWCATRTLEMASTSSSRVLRSAAKVVTNDERVVEGVDNHLPIEKLKASTTSTHFDSREPIQFARVLRSASKNLAIRRESVEKNEPTADITSHKMKESNCEPEKLISNAKNFERILRSSHTKNIKSLSNDERNVDVSYNQFEKKTVKRKIAIIDKENYIIESENDTKNRKRKNIDRIIDKTNDRHNKQKNVPVPSKKSIVKRITFEKDEIVFAKMRGYCSWPAKIVEITDKNPRVNVFFYGTAQHGSVFKSGLGKFLVESNKLEEEQVSPLIRKAIKEALWEYRVSKFESYSTSKSQ